MDNTNPVSEAKMGKQQGKAFIVRQNVTDELWKNHLEGKGAALGIIPITQNNDCRWGCIDIDEYNFDHTSLIKSIRNHKLPLVVCRSKSGGAHVFFIYQRKHSCIIDAIKIKRHGYRIRLRRL